MPSVKLLFVTLLSGMALLAVCQRLLNLVRRRASIWWVFGIGSALRVVVFLYTSTMAVDRHSDSYRFYYPQARRALEQGLSGGAVDTHYSPLFPYLASLAVRVYDSPASIVALMTVCEIAAFWFVCRLARSYLTATRALQVAILYAFSPIAVYWGCVSGHNGVVIHLFLVFAMAMFLRGRDRAAGVVLGVGTALTKFLAFLVCVPFAFLQTRRVRVLTLGLAIPLVVYLLGQLLGARSLVLLLREAGAVGTGNIWSLLRLLLPDGWIGAPLPQISYIAFLGWVYWRVGRRERTWRLPSLSSLMGATFIGFMLLSQKSHTFYAAMFTFPLLVAAVCDERPTLVIVALVLYSAIGIFWDVPRVLWRLERQLAGEAPSVVWAIAYEIGYLSLTVLLLHRYLRVLFGGDRPPATGGRAAEPAGRSALGAV